jgi:phosphate transport system substrate-binding protein
MTITCSESPPSSKKSPSPASLPRASAQAARDYISIVGSSTVYPFSTVVAEQFGKTSRFKTPKVESTGSGGGIKLFCGGVGVQHPDIA